MRYLLLSLAAGALALAVAVPAQPGDAVPAPPREGRPNVLVDASAALVDAAVRRPVDRVEPVNDVILNTPVCGVAHSLGGVRGELVPDPGRVVVDLVLDGTVFSRTVASQRHVLLYAEGVTPFAVRRRVVFDAGAFHDFPGPTFARSTATLTRTTNRLGDPHAPAARLARLAFRRQKAAAEAESAAHTASQAAQRLGDDLKPELVRAGEAVAEALATLRGAGLVCPGWQLSTTCDRLSVGLRLATPGQPVPAAAPALPADAALGLRLHQAAVNGAARALLGGKEYAPLELASQVETLSRSFFRVERDEANGQDAAADLDHLQRGLGGPIRILLAEQNPLTVSFAGGQVGLEVHIAEVRVGEEAALWDVKAQATYRLENGPTGVAAVRHGPALLVKESGADASSPELLPRSLLDDLFGERLTLADVPLPLPAGPARQLRPERAETHGGWLLVAWRLEEAAR